MADKCLICLLTLAVISLMGGSSPSTAEAAGLGGAVVSDFKYMTNNALLDVEDIVTAPLYIAAPDSPLRTPKFYLVLAGAGALWGGSYSLDQTVRSHLRSMSSNDANMLQDISYAGVSAGTALLYGYGLWFEDPRARHYALNAGEGAGIATLLNLGIKAGFGRLRPSQTASHTAFFHGGQSFVSGDVTPMFALAAGVSEYFHNEWYVAAPAYSLALLDGFGRWVTTRTGFRTWSALHYWELGPPNSSSGCIIGTTRNPIAGESSPSTKAVPASGALVNSRRSA